MARKSSKMGKLEHEARALIGKRRRGAKLTREDQLRCLGNIARAMQRYGLQSIHHIRHSHVSRFAAELRDKELSAGRMANYATAMRVLCSCIGKIDIVPSNRELGCSRDLANRTKFADVRMDLAKAEQVRSQLSANNQIAYDMAKCFGLRQKESLLSHLTIRRESGEYLIVTGSKGGRQREVKIVTVEQRTVLAQNAAYRDAHNGLLIDSLKSLSQGLKQLQNELGASGATRTSGANMHTLRREWIIERCQEIKAAPAEQRENMLRDLVESVGHGRVEVVRAYTRLLDDDDK